MKVDMNLLKQLRAMTFAPLKDCKDALVDAEGDLDKATVILKEKGILTAGKKANRETNEWLVKFAQEWDRIAGIKLLCETDFVAKNDKFLELLDLLLKKVIDSGEEFENVETAPDSFIDEIKSIIHESIWTIWENIQLWDIHATSKKAFAYNHPGNKAATLLYFEWDDLAIAKELALQVTAMNPTYLSLETVDKDYYNELEAQFKKELEESNKPAEVIEQILKWKIQKALWEVVLLEQWYIRDWSKKIKNILPEWFSVQKYIRYTI